jgi:Chaperone of endosialidase
MSATRALIRPILGLSALALTAIGCATGSGGTVTTVSADDPLSVTNPSTTPHISLGTVPAAKGGTGLSAPGAAGQFLRSDGSAWISAAPTAPDVPAGSPHYIHNSTSQQPGANFNIAGTGTAAILDAATQFHLGGGHILSAPGGNLFAGRTSGGTTTGAFNSFFGHNTGPFNNTGARNSFFGDGAGVGNTTGSMNSFFGNRAGHSSSVGSNNTFIGATAGNPNFSTQVSNSTAIGFGATVSTSHTIVLGTNAETTRIPGKVIMGGGPMVGGGVVESFDIGAIEGLFTGTVVLTGLNNIEPSPVRVCIRTTSLGGGFGGEGLTRCTFSLSSVHDKTDVQPFSSGLDVIDRLQPVVFNRKGDGVRDIGLNAEEVAEVLPLLVTRADAGGVAEVKEAGLAVLFINAFKEQQAQIRDQRQQIDKQHREIEALKKRQHHGDAVPRSVAADRPAGVCRSANASGVTRAPRPLRSSSR